MNETKKKKQSPKKGHVVRASESAWSFLCSRQGAKETIKQTLDHVVNAVINHEAEVSTRGRILYMLPESRIVCDSLAEARGQAILVAVRGRKKVEQPVAVREVE